MSTESAPNSTQTATAAGVHQDGRRRAERGAVGRETASGSTIDTTPDVYRRTASSILGFDVLGNDLGAHQFLTALERLRSVARLT